jgi:predicted RNase H-like nuclease (RuvC/YqgF family)
MKKMSLQDLSIEVGKVESEVEVIEKEIREQNNLIRSAALAELRVIELRKELHRKAREYQDLMQQFNETRLEGLVYSSPMGFIKGMKG